MMRSLGERIVPDTVWLALPCRRFQHCCVWVWKVKEYHSQITPHVKKDMGFKSWQTVQSPCSMAHRLGLCDICRELPWWDDTALHTQGLSAPRNSRWRDPWRRMRDENGNRKWWDYSEYQRQRPEGPEERESDVHLMTISYTENVPSALEILILSHNTSLVNYLILADWRNLKVSLSHFLIPIQVGQARCFKWLPDDF